MFQISQLQNKELEIVDVCYQDHFYRNAQASNCEVVLELISIIDDISSNACMTRIRLLN